MPENSNLDFRFRNNGLVAFIWIFSTALAMHFLFSRLGFNPTDDGFTLAYARRLLDGQIPHRDFIIIRPALSPLLHTPEVFFGGAYTYWISRFVALAQWSSIAWFSTSFISRGLGRPLGILDQVLWASISLSFFGSSFSILVWHTIDGLFFCTLALSLLSRRSFGTNLMAYFLLGLAYLCKQSFVLVAPITLLIFCDWKNWRYVLAAATAGILYVAFLLVSGGMSDGLEQLFSQKGIVKVGIQAYMFNRVYLGLVWGFSAMWLFSDERTDRWLPRASTKPIISFLILSAFIGFFTNSLWDDEIRKWSFSLFGALGGTLVYLGAWGGAQKIRAIQTGAAIALVAWSSSLSLGYNNPVMGSGMIIVFFLGLLLKQIHNAGTIMRRAILLLGTIMAISAFYHAKTTYIYRDSPAANLTEPLGEVFPGGRLIMTNPRTYAFLEDLNVAIAKVSDQKKKYSIIPAVAGYWAKSAQENPLPIDWAQTTELNTPALLSRVTDSIENQRTQQLVIVQKFVAEHLPQAQVSIDSQIKYYAVVHYVRNNLQKVDETEYFEIFQ